MQLQSPDFQALPIAGWIGIRDALAEPSSLVLDEVCCEHLAIRIVDGCFKDHKFAVRTINKGETPQPLPRMVIIWLQQAIVRVSLLIAFPPQSIVDVNALHTEVIKLGVQVRDGAFKSRQCLTVTLSSQTRQSDSVPTALQEAGCFSDEVFNNIFHVHFKDLHIMLEAAAVLLLYIRNSPVVSRLQHHDQATFVQDTFTDANELLLQYSKPHPPNFNALLQPGTNPLKFLVLLHTSNFMRVTEAFLKNKPARKNRVMDIATRLVDGQGYSDKTGSGNSADPIRREVLFAFISGILPTPKLSASKGKEATAIFSISADQMTQGGAVSEEIMQNIVRQKPSAKVEVRRKVAVGKRKRTANENADGLDVVELHVNTVHQDGNICATAVDFIALPSATSATARVCGSVENELLGGRARPIAATVVALHGPNPFFEFDGFVHDDSLAARDTSDTYDAQDGLLNDMNDYDDGLPFGFDNEGLSPLADLPKRTFSNFADGTMPIRTMSRSVTLSDRSLIAMCIGPTDVQELDIHTGESAGVSVGAYLSALEQHHRETDQLANNGAMDVPMSRAPSTESQIHKRRRVQHVLMDTDMRIFESFGVGFSENRNPIQVVVELVGVCEFDAFIEEKAGAPDDMMTRLPSDISVLTENSEMSCEALQCLNSPGLEDLEIMDDA